MILRMVLGALTGLIILSILRVSKENYIFIIPLFMALFLFSKKKKERTP